MSDGLRDIAVQLGQHIEMLQASGVVYIPGKSKSLQVDEKKSDEVNPQRDSGEEALTGLRAQVITCTKCAELVKNRHTVVFGSGNTNAELVFVGEAPGFHEDQQGLPFVGRAGELLTKMIEAMGLKRKDVFICNVLKCRPPNNRNPSPEEVLNCEPYLIEQIKLIGPKVICAMGNFAAQTLLRTQRPISQIRGSVHDYKGIPCVATFHPAYLLRNPLDKRKAWNDLKTIMQILGLKSKK